MTADSDAFATIQTLGLSPAEEQYGQSVARGEGFYGRGWGNAKLSAADAAFVAANNVDPSAGVGSFNWGAVQGSGARGSFPHIDHHSNGQPYIGRFKKYGNDAEGATDFLKVLLKPNLRQALATGFYPGPPPLRPGANANQKKFHAAKLAVANTLLSKLRAAVYTQHDNGYFELDPDKYLSAVKTNYDKLTAALKWPTLLTGVVGGPAPVVPLDSPGSLSSESEPQSGSLPEAGFLRGQKFSVPGVQDEKE